jgi:hypothetical protein
MSSDDYHSSFTAKSSPEETYKKISQVAKWWSENFEGSSAKVEDSFTLRFKNGDWYKIKVVELVPAERIVWDVMDAEQTWHEDRDEWKGTKIIWEIRPTHNGSEIGLTHEGLVPELECFENSKMGWDLLMQPSLLKFLNEGKGSPQST